MGFVQLGGAAALLKVLDDAVDLARDPGEYWVGSAVFYGPFGEFGTSTMAPRPHWSTSIRVIAIRYELQANQNMLVSALATIPGGMVKIIAFDLEREVKIQITRVGFLDTGNYRGSIAADKTLDEAFAKSAALADPSTVGGG